MAEASVTYISAGDTDTFTFSFEYLSLDHIYAYVNGVEDTTKTFPTSSSVQLSAMPSVDDVIVISRVTPRSALIVTIPNSGTFRGRDINNQSKQALYLAQEAFDALTSVLPYDESDNTYDASTRRIKNLVDPVNAQDAVTKNYADTGMTSQLSLATAAKVAALASQTAAAASATAAASSASSASSSASAASSSASTASTAATTATAKSVLTAADAVSTAADRAAASTSAGAAASSASSASSAASSASTSSSAASSSASSASTSASAAATSASAAAASATTASTQATNAASSASAAAASASTATTKASDATTQASNASTSASAASTSASNASSSASAAASSATAAATSATSAASSASAAAASLDSFDDRYLGPKAVAPTLDNDGNALIEGALYWDTVTKRMNVWNGSSWVDFVVNSTLASGVTFSAAGNISSTNVQAAIEELDTEKAAASHTHTASEITDFTEATQDVIGAILADATEFNYTYNDAGNTETLSLIDNTIVPARLAASATSKFFGRKTAGAGAGEELSASDAKTILAITSADISNFTEATQDVIGALLTDQTEFNYTYDDAGNAESLALIDNTIAAARLKATATSRVFGRITAGAGAGEELTAANLKTILALASTDLSDFTEASQDVIGALLADSTEIDYTYNDAGNAETISLINNTIVAARLKATATSRVFGRITAGAGAGEELTPANLVTMINTADGSGSGLDADLLDGSHASAFDKSWTLLGTISTTTGATASITGLGTTNNEYMLVFKGVSHNGGASQNFQLATSSNNGSGYGTANSLLSGNVAAGNTLDGVVYILDADSTSNKQIISLVGASGGQHGITQFVDGTVAAVNALRVQPTNNGSVSFDAGSIDVYSRAA